MLRFFKRRRRESGASETARYPWQQAVEAMQRQWADRIQVLLSRMSVRQLKAGLIGCCSFGSGLCIYIAVTALSLDTASIALPSTSLHLPDIETYYDSAQLRRFDSITHIK